MPETNVLWFIIIGGLLLSMALSGTVLRRLPLTTSILYLALGIALGPAALGLIGLHPVEHAAVLELVSEVAVLISLFAAGLKLRLPFSSPRWWAPIRLAFVSMVVTVALVAAAGMIGLGLPLGAAILLGAVLAPTDPVLASDVQVEHAWDRDRLRFSLTGEAGLNDGVAFPFVMLGLGLLGLRDLGRLGWRWLAVDVAWAIAGGLGIGWLLGFLVAKLVLYLRRNHQEAVGLDDFVTLGLIALAYGAALLLHAYGFLAVFAAGLALRRVEREATDGGAADDADDATDDVQEEPAAPPAEEQATHPERAPAYLAHAVLAFNEQVERIAEVTVVLLIGGLLLVTGVPGAALWFAPLLLLVIRPLSVWIGLLGADVSPVQRRLIGWFGIRGIGSLYYLSYAIAHGLPDDLASRLSALTLTVVAVSIVVHGISVTPLMRWYGERGRRSAATAGSAGRSAD